MCDKVRKHLDFFTGFYFSLFGFYGYPDKTFYSCFHQFL